MHFVYRHVLNTVVILEEGKFSHPWYTRCDILVPQQALNRRHLDTTQCKKGSEQKRQQLAEAETREISERAFENYREPIKNVSDLKYMGRVLMAGDNNWLAVLGNLGRCGGVGGGCCRLLAGREQTQRCRGPFIQWLPRQSYSLGRRHGSSLRGWIRPWTVFSPGSRGGSLRGNRGKIKTGARTNHRWRGH